MGDDPAHKRMRQAEAAPAACDGCSTATAVPVIDVGPFLQRGAASGTREAVVQQVRRACEEVGFFVVTGHGLDPSLPRACAQAAKEFFARPEDEKAKVAAGGRAYGFFPLSSEALGYDADVAKRPDIREAFSMGPQEDLPPEGSPDRPGGPPEVVEFCYQPTGWPADAADGRSLRSSMKAYYAAAGKLGDRLFEIFAEALDVDAADMLAKSRQHASSLRVVHYPALEAAPQPGQLRCGAHSDICVMTLLWQDVHGGLEVLPRGHTEWLEVRCPPDGLVVNLGDLFARWTNDRWLSTPHRVSCPPSAFESARISMPYFHILRSDAEVRCLPSCLGPGEEPRYPPTSQGEDLKQHFTRWGRNRE